MNTTKAERLLQRRIPNLFIDQLVISYFKECTPKILIFTDGLNFNSNNDFGLTDFVDTIKNTSIHGMTPIVETAHSGNSAADHTNFTFTSSTLSKSKYDVLFLFGAASSGSLPAPEVSVISKFMDDGGGVFATGDHSYLGMRLCGNIKRIKEMRRWAGPSAGGTDRISTNDPGADNTFQFEDQSDTIPQKIYPAYTGNQTSSAPHYLLQHPTKKIIEVLPDHPHESECTVPNSLASSDWPEDSLGNAVSPEVVAISVSYGGGFTGKEPISTPRSFNAIVAYDGHNANVGRISTDATWHHFININLINTSSGPGLIANPDAYDRVNTYFGNIAKWLMPKNTRRCLRWPIIIAVKEMYPIKEFLFDIKKSPDLTTLLELGQEMQTTLARVMTPGEQQEFVTDLFEMHSEDLAQQITSLHKQSNNIEDQIGLRTAPLELMEQAALGAVVHAVATAVPTNSDLETCLKEIGGSKGLTKITKRTLKHAFKELSSAVYKGRERIDTMLDHC
ncbi:MAG: hypothetical protein ABFR02_05610 [Campylobacterota bacterium]